MTTSKPLIAVLSILLVSSVERVKGLQSSSPDKLANRELSQKKPKIDKSTLWLNPAAYPVDAGMSEDDIPSPVPTGKKFVILLRGQSFRYRSESDGLQRHGCQDWAEADQLALTTSFVNNVILPLEEADNQVQIVVTDCNEEHKSEPCHLTPKLMEVLGKDRIVGTKFFDPAGQPYNIRNAIEFLKETFGGGAGDLPEKADFLLVARHDLHWMVNIKDWAVDYDKFNFFARCEEHSGKNVGGENCVWDTIHFMPTRLFSIFDATVGPTACFPNLPEEKLNGYNGHGHACYAPITEALANTTGDASVGFITGRRHRVRGLTGVVDLIMHKGP